MSSSPEAASRLSTTLGPELERHGSAWVLDLAAMPIFHGLSVLSRALGETVLAQMVSERIDVSVERQLKPSENPELIDRLGVTAVKLASERQPLAGLERDPERLQDCLRTIFGTLQQSRYREALTADPPQALVFHLPGAGKTTLRFVLELVAPREKANFFLRVTIEDPRGRRIDLATVPHLVVEDLGRRRFIAGSTRIAQSLAEGARREAARGRRAHSERRRLHSHLFRQLDKSGLDSFEEVELSWPETFLPEILESEPEELDHALKRVLLALEDKAVRDLLGARETVRVDCGGFSIWLEATQLARVLHVSLGERRERIDLDAFLERMPFCEALAGDSGALAGIAVYLVHHMTSEVLGLIAALRRLGCRDLVCQFVAYAGDPPGDYLAPLLDLPPDEFRSLSLINIPDAESVEGHYRLSRQYSPLESAGELEAALAHGGNSHRYLDAMRSVAVPCFLRQLERAREAGRRLLIIEDGGYLVPALHRACLEGATVGAWRAAYGLPDEDPRDLRSHVEPVLIGSVEHTRNGFDRLAKVESEFGGLAFPVFTVAISRLKREVEAQEVAVSVLNAIENALHADGRILSRRNCLLLGSRGAIGSRLRRALEVRLERPPAQLRGVDLQVETPPRAAEILEARAYRDLPKRARLATDLVIGVVGESVLEGGDLEEWLLESDHRELVLASGSTKTEEFRGIARWIEERLRAPRPTIGGHAVEIRGRDLADPLTGRVFGHRYEFAIAGDAPRRRSLLLLAKSTPVNFMFYGVPTEIIDEVLAQLLSSGLGLARRAAAEAVPHRLLAVDRDIDAAGEDLVPAAAPVDGRKLPPRSAR